MIIATWNLQSDKPRTREREAAFRQAVDGVGADVWVLTETWADYSPAGGYQAVAQSDPAPDLNPWPDRRWVAIWARPGLISTPVEIHCPGDRLVCGRIQLPGGQAVVIVGTVLPWPSDELWRGGEGYCAALAVQRPVWERLCAQFPADGFVIAGDFNQSLPHRRYYGSKKAERALGAALRRLDLLCLTQGDDRLSGKPRIDHVCVRRTGHGAAQAPPASEWEVPAIEGHPVSDHCGVCVKLDRL
jgi:hypothetical protein